MPLPDDEVHDPTKAGECNRTSGLLYSSALSKCGVEEAVMRTLVGVAILGLSFITSASAAPPADEPAWAFGFRVAEGAPGPTRCKLLSLLQTTALCSTFRAAARLSQ